MTVAEKVLLAILATPPETSGERTLKRLELAREILGFQRVAVVNVLDVPTFRTNGMTTAGADPEPWLESRPAISKGLDECHGVVLGYGVSEPSGPARGHYRDQIDWLWGELRGSESPIWSVELPPRHPSRWHRLTYKSAPGSVFADVLATVLLPVGMPGELPAAVRDIAS
jgi:hypothetical protein